MCFRVQNAGISYFLRWIKTIVLLLYALAACPDRIQAQSLPGQPTGLSTEDGNTQVRLRWIGPDDPTITRWQFAQKLEPLSSQQTASFGAWTDMPGSDADTRRHTVTGLLNNRTYRFKIRGVNSDGPGQESDEATGEPYPAVPEKPVDFRAIPGDGKAVLMWNHPDDVSIWGWEYRQKESGGEYGRWKVISGAGPDTTSHTVGNLANGTEYAFELQAYNGSGLGWRSDEITVSPMAAAPGKPTGLSVDAGDARAVLTWDNPGNDTIEKWQYAYDASAGDQDWTDMAGSGAETVRHVVAMLENGITYSFRIRAVNDVGPGAESDAVSAVPMAAAPGKPAGLAALAGDGQVTLSWKDPVDASILKWQYAYKTTDGFGDWIDIPGSSAATTSHVVSGLANGATYTLKIRAVNGVGAGPDSDEAAATPLPVPVKPAGLTVTAGDARATLEWNDPLNSTITGWQYAYRTSGDYSSWTDMAGSGAATTGHIVTGLANGVEHRFKIRAVNGSGYGAESDSAAATPRPVPAQPSGLRTEAGNTQVRLVWNDPGDGTISGWQYQFRTTGAYGAWVNVPGGSAATVRHTVAGLVNSTEHVFRIRALNGSGAGPESEAASATPKEATPAQPTGFRVAPGDGEALLSWDDPDDASIQGWQYKGRKSDEGYKAQWDDVPGSGAKTVRHTVTGLDNGATYSFKIRAVNAANGDESEEQSATARSLRPAAPTGLSARSGDGEVALAWDDPGDSSISGWQYAARTTGGFGGWVDIPGSAASTTAHTVTGLENGVGYGFKLRAVNEHGGGAESGEVSATPLAIPAKPSGLTATPGDERVALAWDDQEDPSVTGWQYKAEAAGETGNWTDVPDSDAETVAHIVSGLDNGATYRFRVRALNASGSGPESDEAAVTLPSLPAKPAGLAATPGDGKVLLAWTALGDSSVTLWQYSYSTDGGHGVWTDIPDSDAATTSHEVTGLDNGTLHTFRIRAANSSGFGLASDEVTATPFALPGKPSGFTATPGNRQVLLQWDDLDNPDITGWEYKQRRGDGAYEDYWTVILGSGAATTSHMVIGLEAGVSYGFKVRAALGEHVGPESDEAAVTLPSLPAKPAGLAATPGDGKVLLAWMALGDSSVTLWQYSYRTGSSNGAWTDIPDSYATTVGYTVSGLDNGTMYSFRIRAVNSNGFGLESDEVTATPFVLPGKPSGFTATPGSGQALLQWDDPDNPGITGWEYKQRRGDGAYEDYWTVILGSGAATTSHTVIGLEAGAAYGFKVRAVSREGVGAESDEAIVTLTPVPARPAGLVAIPGDGRVLLEWTALGDPTVTLWQYSYRTDGDHGAWTDIPDGDAATTSHEVTGLESGTPHTFRVRAANSSGFGLASDEITTVPILVLAKPEGLRVMPGDGSALLEWNDPDEPRLVRWQYVAGASGSSVADAWIDMAGSGPGTTRHVVEGLDNGTAYIFRVRFCISENRVHPDCSPGSDPVSATPEGAAAHPLARKAVKVVLADLAGRMAAGAEAAIEARLSPDAVSTRFVLAGRDLSLVAPVGEERARLRAGERMEAVGISGRDARRNSAFQFSPGPAGRDDALQWSLWHRGDLTAFEGAAGPQAHYGGQLLSGWLGVDMRWNERWLAGVALARSKAEVDYVAGAEAGVLKATFDSVHPYLQRRFRDGGTAWLILGGGRGRIENTSGGRGGETADADMASASAGYRSPLPEFGGLKISAFGAAGFARLDVDGTAQTIIGAQSVAADRQSVGIEAALDEGQTSRYAAMSLRRDGGDGTTGRGLELASGFRAPLPASLGQIDFRFRWLAWHSERNYREFGLAAHLHHQEDAGRPGLSWSLDATHGPPGGGRGAPGPLWSDEPQAPHGGPPAPVVNLRAGWNFVSPGAVFTPQAEIGLTAAHVQRLALGFDTGPLSGPMLTLAAERRTPRAGAPENRISAAMRFRF